MSSVRYEAGRAAKQIPRITHRWGGIERIFAPAAASFTVTAYRGTFTGPGFTIQRLLFTRPFFACLFPGGARQPMDIETVCACCGRPFTAHQRTQRFCSEACRSRAYRKQPGRPAHEVGQGAVLRVFTCARCGKLVKVTSLYDRRKKFCSSHCERLYWKHSGDTHLKEVCRTFRCRQCGKAVTITDPHSRRRVFCSDLCRITWQREQHHRKTGNS